MAQQISESELVLTKIIWMLSWLVEKKFLMMNEIAKTVLSLSVSGTLLLFMLWGLKRFYKDRFSRRWQYYIWIIAVLRFLLPFTPDTAIVGSLFDKFDTAAAVMMNERAVDTGASAAGAVDKGGGHQEDTGVSDEGTAVDSGKVGMNTGVSDAPAIATHRLPDIEVGLFIVWLTVALVLFVRKIAVYRGFVRYIRADGTEVDDIPLLNLLSDCGDRLHIRTRVSLYCNGRITSPMLTGFVHPCIVLPVHARQLAEKELSYVFVHELIHYRQRDIFYKWLVQVAVCVHWFNPFVYLMEKEINKSCELSCDETVLSVFGDSARRAYGDMLISFVKAGSSRESPLASITLTEGAGQLKERLGAIMKYKKKSRGIRVFAAVCTAAFCACFMAAGAYAAPSVSHDAMIWKDDEIHNEVLTEDGVYYIFCDGADREDKPQASVSSGSVLFVVVRKDGYTTVGPFDNMQTLMEDVAAQCAYMGGIAQKEKDSVLETAATIDRGSRYSYVQRAFYADGYMIEMGWNLRNPADRKCMEITLADHSVMTVYFGNMLFGDSDGNAAAYMDDPGAVSAIANLIDSLKETSLPGYPAVEAPGISNVTYVGTDLPALAQQYLASGNTLGFEAVFEALDASLQAEYCKKLYDNNQMNFFAAILPHLGREELTRYAEKADHDRKTNCLMVILNHMTQADVDAYAEKYYEADDFGRFVNIAFCMTQDQRQEWLARAKADHKDFCSTFLEDMNFP